MSVLFDVATTAFGVGVSSLTTPSFTVSAAARRAAMIIPGWELAPTVTGASIASLPATFIPGTSSGDNIEAWGRVSPPSGSQTANVTWSGNVNALLNVIVASDVDQATSFDGGAATALTIGGNASQPVVGVDGGLTCAAVVGYDEGFNPAVVITTLTGTERANVGLPAPVTARLATSTQPGTGGSFVHSWTITSGANPGLLWAAVGAQFRPAQPVFDQEGFRFRNDDGSEITATPIAAQDVDITRGTNVNTRLRGLVDSTGGDAMVPLQLEYRQPSEPEWHPMGRWTP